MELHLLPRTLPPTLLCPPSTLLPPPLPPPSPLPFSRALRHSLVGPSGVVHALQAASWKLRVVSAAIHFYLACPRYGGSTYLHEYVMEVLTISA